MGADLNVGNSVELHVRYSDSWSAGFEIAAVVAGGYRVKRMSDGSLLPGTTGSKDVRLAGQQPVMLATDPPVKRRTGRGHVDSYGEERTCLTPGCTTTLSRYNSGMVCAVHGARESRA